MLVVSVQVCLQLCRVLACEGQLLCREGLTDKPPIHCDGKGGRGQGLFHGVIEDIRICADMYPQRIIPVPNV